MVTYALSAGMNFWEIRGKSTERVQFTQDNSIPNGSSYYEMDTGKLYMYDADSAAWLEQ